MSPIAPSVGTSSTFNAVVNLAKYCIGAGILALPHATAEGGLLFSPIMIGVVAAWNWLASSQLMECKHATRTVAYPPHLSSNYSRIAYAGAGNWGVLLADFSIIITLLGVCIAFQITFATLLREVPGNTLSTSALTLISGVVVYPMSSLRDLNSISGLSLLGMLCLVAGVVAILAHGIQAYGGEVYSEYAGQSIIEGHTASAVYVPLWPQTLQGAGAFMGVTIFCFDICSLAFPIEDSMRTKADFSKAVIYALSAVWLVYVLLGNIGAVLYVHDGKEGIRENILSNLPVHSSIALLVRWAMACVGLLTYPITLAPAAQMLEHYVILRSPLLQCGPNTGGYHAIVEESQGGGTVSDRGDSQHQPAVPAVAVAEASTTLRCTNRLVMVAATTFIAAALPCFGTVISLLGGFTIAILDFILPPLLHMRILGFHAHLRLPQCASSEGGINSPGGVIEMQALESQCDTQSETHILKRAGHQHRYEQGGLMDETYKLHMQSGGLNPSADSTSSQHWLVLQDAALLTMGMLVCVLTTAMALMNIYNQVLTGNAC